MPTRVGFLQPSDLQPADILLKWLPDHPSVPSRLINLYQSTATFFTMHHTGHYFEQHFGLNPNKFTHSAIVYTDNSILEYDENAGFLEIMKFHGKGCLKLNATDDKHLNNHYLVIRCNEENIVERACGNMEYVYEHWEQKKTSSYGVRKLVGNIFGYRGSHYNTQKISEIVSKIAGEQHSWFKSNRQNFFCSQFVCFIYLWAMADLIQAGSKFEHISDLFDIDQARIPPSELAIRLIKSPYFSIVGEYSPSLTHGDVQPQ